MIFATGAGTGALPRKFALQADNSHQLYGNLYATGPIQVSHGGGVFFRERTPTHSVFHYTDAGTHYFLVTNPGDPGGGWNGLRPFYFNLNSGDVVMGHAVNIGGGLTAGSTTINGTASISGTLTAGGLACVAPANGGSLRIGENTVGYNKYIRTNTNANLEFINHAYSAIIASLNDGGYWTCNGMQANGDVNCTGDFWSRRSSNQGTGIIYLGNSGARYLYWDGGNYQMPNGSLNLGGGLSCGDINTNGWMYMNAGACQIRAPNGYLLLNPFNGPLYLRSNTEIKMADDNGVTTTVSGPLNCASNIRSNGATMGNAGSYWSTTYGGSSSALEIRSGDASWDSYLSFHIPGAFGCNFGLKAADKNLWFGGWSFGQGNEYRLWSTRDFGNVSDNSITSIRLAYAGESTPGNTNMELWPGSVTVGAGSGIIRNRYLQFLYNGGWYTASLA
jgi:hypothetical protein